MSLQAYNDACLRAELFGQPKPDKEEFLEKNKHLDVVEFREDEMAAVAAGNTAALGEKLGATSGGLTELGALLGSTQSKLNRLKGVCGSLTNMLRFKLTSKDNLSYSSEPSYVGQTNYDTDYRPGVRDVSAVDDVNAAIEGLEEMRRNENVPASMDIKNKVDGQLDKLDALIAKADRANDSVQYQNKQMRGFLR